MKNQIKNQIAEILSFYAANYKDAIVTPSVESFPECEIGFSLNRYSGKGNKPFDIIKFDKEIAYNGKTGTRFLLSGQRKHHSPVKVDGSFIL